MTTHPDRRADGQGQFRWPDFDVYGNVNGVNTAIFSSSGVWVGIAFDIPADIVKAGVVQFKEPATWTAAGWGPDLDGHRRHRRQHVGRAGCDNDLHIENHRHDPWHRERHAARRRIVALPAGLYIRQARLEDRLVLGRERWLLRAAERFCLIPLIADPDRFAPYPWKIRVLAVIERARGGDRQRGGKRDDGERTAETVRTIVRNAADIEREIDAFAAEPNGALLVMRST
jgi:hypothetical protein